MKGLFVLVIVVGISGSSACSQKLKDSQVPAATKIAFQKQYPNTKASWDKEDANYEVNFKKGGKEMSAIIQENGTIVETETMISLNDLPAPVSDYMNKHYKGSKVKDAAKIVKANGKVNYEAEIAHKDIVFDGNGKFLKEEKE
jgi:putative PepSY-like beta-lactamase-inhibitor